MTLGTGDKKKVGLLCALALAGGYLFYANVLAGPDTSPAPAAPAPRAAEPPQDLAPPAPAPAPAPARPRASSRARSDEFHPVLRSSREEDRVDPATIDPILRLDLLAKLQNENPAGGARNLFQFGQAPLPKAELPKGPEPKIVPKGPKGPPLPVTAGPPKAAPEPPPPPVTFKYYGYANSRGSGKKTAFFMDGDDILVAAEGDTLQRRYRVVRIGVNSVVVEDTVSKRQQPVPLTPEPAGA
jgi:hypothetical protein